MLQGIELLLLTEYCTCVLPDEATAAKNRYKNTVVHYRNIEMQDSTGKKEFIFLQFSLKKRTYRCAISINIYILKLKLQISTNLWSNSIRMDEYNINIMLISSTSQRLINSQYGSHKTERDLILLTNDKKCD